MSKSGASCHLDVPSSCPVCGNDTAVIETQMLLAIGQSKETSINQLAERQIYLCYFCLLFLQWPCSQPGYSELLHWRSTDRQLISKQLAVSRHKIDTATVQLKILILTYNKIYAILWFRYLPRIHAHTTFQAFRWDKSLIVTWPVSFPKERGVVSSLLFQLP